MKKLGEKGIFVGGFVVEYDGHRMGRKVLIFRVEFEVFCNDDMNGRIRIDRNLPDA